MEKETIGENWSPGDTANTSIGKVFLILTPLQMASMTASLARNETQTTPTLKALARDSITDNFKAPDNEAIGLTPSQRALLLKGMEGVVSSNGTGRLVKIEDLPIAGKTGTADFRAHGKEVNLAWFIGFAPINNPKIAVAVMVQGTRESDRYHGGSTAGPIAKDIFLAFQKKHLKY